LLCCHNNKLLGMKEYSHLKVLKGKGKAYSKIDHILHEALARVKETLFTP